MAKFARLNGANTVVEIFEHSTILPSQTHIPEIAAQFMPCPDSVEMGAAHDPVSGTWTNAPVVTPPVVLPTLTPMQFYLAFTPAERIAIKSSADDHVREFWATYELAVQLNKTIDPNLPSVKQAVEYLAQTATDTPAGPGILASKDRIAQILAGIPQ